MTNRPTDRPTDRLARHGTFHWHIHWKGVRTHVRVAVADTEAPEVDDPDHLAVGGAVVEDALQLEGHVHAVVVDDFVAGAARAGVDDVSPQAVHADAVKAVRAGVGAVGLAARRR